MVFTNSGLKLKASIYAIKAVFGWAHLKRSKIIRASSQIRELTTSIPCLKGKKLAR